MAVMEGRGQVSPSPVDVFVPDWAMAYLIAHSEMRSKFRNYSERTDQWGRGLADNALLVGFVGEWAFSTFVNEKVGRKICETDVELRRKGDGGVDFLIAQCRHQIKARRKREGENLIRRIDDKGKFIPIIEGRYVFAQWNTGDERCRLLGWCTSEVVQQQGEFKKSAISDHFNIAVPPRCLLPMGRLIWEIKSDMQQEAVGWL